MKSVRIFLSSTFRDFAWERETLNNHIIPVVNARLQSRGCQIDLIDLRWGVPDEAGLEHATVDICLREIRLCCGGSGRPAFVLLRGERAGWHPLPRVIGADAFAALVRTFEEREISATADLRAWYVLDENHVPSSYALRSRRGCPEADPIAWAAVETRIREAVGACEKVLDPVIFTTPITRVEMELACALAGDEGSMIAVMRRISEDGRGTRFSGRHVGRRSTNLRDDETEQSRLSELVTGAGLDETVFASNGKHDPRYQKQFSDWATDVLLRAAETGELLGQGTVSIPRRRGAETVARRVEADVVRWLERLEGGMLLLFGASGSGKTVLTKRVVTMVEGRFERLAALYLGESDVTLETRTFLLRAGRAIAPVPAVDGAQPAELITSLQSELATGKPSSALMVVDALEQVSWLDPSEALSWLPLRIGVNRKVLLTASDHKIAEAFRDVFSAEAVYDLGEMDDAESQQQIGANSAYGDAS